jgi:opacity protein-like surface antigen
MKRFFILIAFAVFSFASANAETTFKVDAAGDSYFVTDNAKVHFEPLEDADIKGMERQFAFYNPLKGTVGLNHAFLIGRVEGDQWRVNVGAGFRGDEFKLHMEEANAAIKLFGGLWAEGGYFIPSLAGDVDFTFEAWFTGNSLTDYFSSGYQTGMGLFYEVDPTITVRARVLNSAFERNSENRSTSFLFGFDWS